MTMTAMLTLMTTCNIPLDLVVLFETILALETMSRASTSSRRLTHSASKTLAEYSYTLEVSTPIRGTNIYEAVCPHGSHVFVDTDPGVTREASSSDIQTVNDLVAMAEECCEHITGYVIVHPQTTVVKHINGKTYYLPGQGRNTIRVAPLLTLEEIKADPINSGLNADRVSASIFEKMLIHVYDTHESYEDQHIRNAELARQYFHRQADMIDSVVEKAQMYRSKMLTEPGDTTHAKNLTGAIVVLEQLHTHSTLIRSHMESLNSLYDTFGAIHADIQ